MSGYAPTHEYHAQAYVAAVAANAATRQDQIFTAPRACRVTSVSITPQTATTGDASNTKNLNVLNAGAAGSGTTEVGNLDLATGVNLVAFDEKVIPLNTTYTNGVEMTEGDVLVLETELVGLNGVAVGPFHVQVDYVAL